jgi:DNA-binding response OmpR family regulator
MSEPASILVIDDEENLRRTMKLILQREGYVVTTAGSIADARKCLQAGSFNLAFLDLKLPDGSGLSLLPEIRSQYPHMLVIILSAHDKMDVALEAINNGASDYLLKPVDPPFLLARIKEVLAEG